MMDGIGIVKLKNINGPSVKRVPMIHSKPNPIPKVFTSLLPSCLISQIFDIVRNTLIANINGVNIRSIT